MKAFFAAVLHCDRYSIKLDLRDLPGSKVERYPFELDADMALKIYKNWPEILNLLSENNRGDDNETGGESKT